MCKTGKRRHATRVGAIIALKRINNKALNSYWCPTCKGYHLGHSNSDWRMQQRIDQLLGLKR